MYDTVSYYLEWHLREASAELTFCDECPPNQPDPTTKAGLAGAILISQAGYAFASGGNFGLRLEEVQARDDLLLELTGDARILDRDGHWAPIARRAQLLAEKADQAGQQRLQRALQGIDALLARS